MSERIHASDCSVVIYINSARHKMAVMVVYRREAINQRAPIGLLCVNQFRNSLGGACNLGLVLFFVRKTSTLLFPSGINNNRNKTDNGFFYKIQIYTY